MIGLGLPTTDDFMNTKFRRAMLPESEKCWFATDAAFLGICSLDTQTPLGELATPIQPGGCAKGRPRSADYVWTDYITGGAFLGYRERHSAIPAITWTDENDDVLTNETLEASVRR